jgi:2-oxoglutarate ferredoxin oxidoreductase subunit gamma
MQTEFVFSGFGGQGVMFAGQLLTYAAMEAGKEVTWIPSYGPEMRGGTAHCFIVISDSKIGSPIVANPQVAVVFNNPSFDKYNALVAKNGLLVVNRSLVQRVSTRDDLDILYIPANQIAEEIGSTRITNMVLLGAMLQKRPAVTLDTLMQALEMHLPEHHRNLLTLNETAILKGADFARKQTVSLIRASVI